jgi:hypothetical protein
MHLIWISVFWEKVIINITYISMNQEKHYIIKAQDNFFRWFETKTFTLLNSENVIKFL